MGWTVAAVASVAATALVVWSAISIVRFHTVLPVGDQWTFITTDVAKYLAGDYRVGDLFGQHNEHRILWARLVMWTDLLFFDGQQRFGLAMCAAVQAAHALILGWLVWRDGPPAVWQRVFLIALLAALMSWAIQFENFTRAFQVQFVLVFATASACFAFGTSAARAWARSDRRRALVLIIVAYALGVAAALSMINGLLVLPLLVVYLWFAQVPPRWVATTALLAVVVMGGYFIGYQTPPSHTSITAALTQPVSTIRYAALYLGGFLGPHLYTFALGVGLIGAAAALVTPVLLWRAKIVQNRLLAVCALNALFVLLAATTSAAGRVNFEAAQMFVSRYQTPSMVFWWCVLTVAIVLVARYQPAWTATAFCAALLIAAMWSVPPLQSRALQFYDGEHDVRSLAEIGLEFGVVDPHFAGAASKPEVLLPAAAVLQEGAWSTFARPLPLGRSISEFGRSVPPRRCKGRVDKREPVATSPEHGLVERVEGWAAARRGEIRRVLFTDSRGSIVGSAFIGRPRPDVARALDSDLGRSGWAGYVAGTAEQPIRTFVVIRSEGRRAHCELE